MWCSVFKILKATPCASHLTSLCQLSMEATKTLSAPIGMNAFPLLNTTLEDRDRNGDDVVAVAQGLEGAFSTRLAHLNLQGSEPLDQGLAGLGSVVRAGCFERLELLSFKQGIDFERHEGMTEQGALALARPSKTWAKADCRYCPLLLWWTATTQPLRGRVPVPFCAHPSLPPVEASWLCRHGEAP